jgi:hypothetical protein
MMRTLATVVVIILLVHALALLGFAGWLWGSGRLNSDRIRRTVAVFQTTTAQELVAKQKDKDQAQQQAAAAAEAARQERLSGGTTPPQARVDATQREQQWSDLTAQRWAREREDLQRQLKLAQDRVGQERAALTAERQAFDQALAAEKNQRDERDFQKALDLYQQLSPRQVKAIYVTLLQQNGTPQVVEYLAALPPRKSAAILAEFKTPAEVVQAAGLMQMLRDRGAASLAAGSGGSGGSGTPAASGPTPAGAGGTTP